MACGRRKSFTITDTLSRLVGDDDVRMLVDDLEDGVAALPVDEGRDKERAPNKAEALAEIEVELPKLLLPSETNGMMNKRYEWIIALLPRLEGALEPFTTPLFWRPVQAGATQKRVLHYIDIWSPPYKLVLCHDGNITL